MSIESKTCSRCKTTKPLSEFHIKNKQRGTLNPFCKECAKECQKEWYYKHKDRHGKNVDKTRRKRSVAIKKYVDRVKIFCGCILCRYKKCSTALDFHHVDASTKSINLSQVATRRFSNERIKKEMRKCVILCKNCHQEVHEGVTKIPEK